MNFKNVKATRLGITIPAIAISIVAIALGIVLCVFAPIFIYNWQHPFPEPTTSPPRTGSILMFI